MKAKRMLSLLLTAALMLSMMTPAFAAAAQTELPPASQTQMEETNEAVSIRLQATGKLVYGSPFELSVVTRPADVQYIGVVLGVKGEAKGYVTLVLSDKLRTLLKMIPLPRKMSKMDEQPVDSGRYIAGAVALQSGDLNTAGVAMFRIKPKTEGVRLYWAEELPAVTLAEAEAHNTGALLESDGVVANDAKVTYTYKKKGLFSSKSTEFPTEPGTYTQTAQATGNYSCEKITRTIVIY